MKAAELLQVKKDDLISQLSSDDLTIDQINPLIMELNNVESHLKILESVTEKVAAAKKNSK